MSNQVNVENVDLKLDIMNFLNKTDSKKEEFVLLYYNKDTKEILGGLSENYVHLISVLTDVEDLKDKERFRGFIMNCSVNIINQFRKDYLKTMANFIKSLK